ncbi:uncharacterized protein [Salminus brasiliensis]|uniref:uncharacterized protein n=1 Tax=Salminus brasiliensis TaxID=930266 RepID=UPI003B82E817
MSKRRLSHKSMEFGKKAVGWLKNPFGYKTEKNPGQGGSPSEGELKFCCCGTGNRHPSAQKFIKSLKAEIHGLKEVSNEAEADVSLLFCPDETNIEAELNQKLSEPKPAVLVVLHPTSDPEAPVPDSSRSVRRENTLTVDCLYQEDKEVEIKTRPAVDAVTKWIKDTLNQEDGSKTRCSTGPEPPVKKSKKEPPAAAGDLKFLSCVSGKTLGSDEGFIRKLIDGIPGLKEVSTVEECDVILAFCPVVSRAETDIESALKKLQQLSETKPAVLVVLHHTSDPEATVPDSSRSVDRGNTLTVDCLFHEDRGLLQCYSNQRALKKVTQWIKPQAGTPGHKSPCERPDSTGPVPQREGGESEPAAAENAESEAGGTTNIKSEADRGAGTGAEVTGTAGDLKFLSCVSGKTLGSDEGFIRKLIDGIPGLKEVSTVEECDVILAFCPVVSRAETDIESALKKLQQLSGSSCVLSLKL